MTDYLMVGGHAKWQVLWIVKKPKKRPYIVEKEFDNDLTAAIDLYVRVKKAGGRFATLRCKNVAFPPPKKLQPFTETKVIKKKVRGRVRKVKTLIDVTPMIELNLKGITWCPYCRELRKFQLYEQFRMGDIVVPKVGYYCPLCGISTEAGMVKKYNPRAPQVAQRTRRSNGRSRRRRT